MSPKIFELDRGLLRAFVFRELQDFRWANRSPDQLPAEERREVRLNEVMNLIEAQLPSADTFYSVTFKSMANMGYVSRELTLPGKNTKYDTCIECMFDTGTPGRFKIRRVTNEPIVDMVETFGPKVAPTPN